MKKIATISKISKFLLIFVIIVSWVFSGWPQIFNFPPKIQIAEAAISLKTAGTWARIVADPSSVTIPGTPAAGDRMFLFVTWKDYTITVANPTGWTPIGTEFADGITAAGNGLGSVKVMAWYRDWQTGDGNPSVDWSTAPTEGHAVVMLWQKGAEDVWGTPLTVTAGLSWGTSSTTTPASSTVAVPVGSVVLGLIGIRDDSAVMTRPTTGIDDSAAAITWNGNYVESPATHFSSTTGFDMSGDLGHRFVTTGATATLRMTGTISATETGAGKWVIQGLSVVDTPAFNNGTAIYNNDVSVTITVASPASSTICYTTDGSTPGASTPGTCNSSPTQTYSTPVAITANGTVLKAIGTKVGYTNSAVQSATYTLQVADPIFGTNGGSFYNNTATSFSSTTTGAVFCSTLDGSTPAAATPGICSAGATGASATVIATGTAVKVLGTKANYVNSAVQTSNAFTLTVGAITSSPGAGTYSSTQSVSLSIATTTSAVAHYTTDGGAVTCSSTTYTGAFNVSVTTTVKAIGCKTNYVSDTAISDLYTINTNTAPSFSVIPNDSPDPVVAGYDVTFSGTATDSESNSWYLAVCKTNSITAANPPTCESSQTYCVSSAVASGSSNSCIWTSSGLGAQTWYAFACDNYSTPLCSSNSNANSPVMVNAQSLTFSISANAIDFGALSATAARFATTNAASGGSASETVAHTLSASTNASGGYIITVQGATLTHTSNGSFSITAITPSAVDVTLAGSKGTEQFGLRLTQSGTGTATSPYNGAANFYAYNGTAAATSQAASGAGDGTSTTFSVYYASNISAVTEPGNYNTNLTYTATGNF